MALSDVHQAALAFRKKLITLEKKARSEIQGIYVGVVQKMDPWVRSYLRRRQDELAAGVDPHDAGGVANGEKLKLIEALEAELRAISAPLTDTTARAQADALHLANTEAFKLAKIGSQEVELGVTWRKPSFDALAHLVGYAGDGRPLDTYFKARLPAEGAKAVQQALYTSTLLNEAPVNAAKRIKGAVAGNAWRAETIARTEILRTHRETTRQNYLDNDDVILGYQWLAARDSRSCIVCWMLSGKIFKTKDPFGSHVNCRCTLVPITDPEDLKEIPVGAEEFKNRSANQQVDVLGRSKYEAWQQGKLDLNNLVGFRKHPIFGPIRWERGLKDALKGGVPGAIPPQPKTLKAAPPKKKPVTTEAPFDSVPLAPPPPGKQVEPKAPPQIPKAPQEPLEAPTRSADAFPWDTELPLLKPVRKLGGSTGAELVEDDRGNLWVRKHGATADHIRSEIAADNIYRALGVNVPEAKLYETDKGPVKLARFIEGETLDKLTGHAKAVAQQKLQDGFVADALLGNWDVLGLSSDNILIGKDKKVWRIDNGGALKYRAQGGLKSEFDQHPFELWTMRSQAKNSKLGANVFETFGELDAYDVSRQITKMMRLDQDALKATFPPDIKAVMEGRLAELYNLQKHWAGMGADNWRSEYADEVGYQALKLRKEGIIDTLPKTFESRPGPKASYYDDPATRFYDEKGDLWDKLRNGQSTITYIHNYFEQENLQIEIISEWQDAQSGSSWSSDSLAFKHFLSKKAQTRADDYYWRFGSDSAAKQHYEDIALKHGGEDVYFNTQAAYKALNLEFLARVKFDKNLRSDRTMELLRTEDRAVLDNNGFAMTRQKEEGTIKRSVFDSFSAHRRVEVGGTELTVQTVPHAAIHGIYFFRMSKYASRDQSGFMSDAENEFVATHHKKKLEWRKK